jgi:hypothetical protein
MYLSVFVTVLSLLAFFWLAGVLDWRGSEGRYKLRVVYDCEKSASPQSFHLHVLLDREDAKVLYDGVDFDLKKGEPCKSIRIVSDPAILRVDDFYNKPIAAERRDVPLITGAPSGRQDIILSTAQFAATGHDVGLLYKQSSLLEYVGLSERSMVMSLEFPLYGGHTGELAGGHVSITPPDGFKVVESSLPGAPGTSEPDWEVEIPKALRETPPLRLKMRNERLSRLDHILDSSVAALLGVGVGGMVNAYLALILLRRSHRHRPS